MSKEPGLLRKCLLIADDYMYLFRTCKNDAEDFLNFHSFFQTCCSAAGSLHVISRQAVPQPALRRRDLAF